MQQEKKLLQQQLNQGADPIELQSKMIEVDGLLAASKRKIEEHEISYKILDPDGPDIRFKPETGDVNEEALRVYNKIKNSYF